MKFATLAALFFALLLTSSACKTRRPASSSYSMIGTTIQVPETIERSDFFAAYSILVQTYLKKGSKLYQRLLGIAKGKKQGLIVHYTEKLPIEVLLYEKFFLEEEIRFEKSEASRTTITLEPGDRPKIERIRKLSSKAFEKERKKWKKISQHSEEYRETENLKQSESKELLFAFVAAERERKRAPSKLKIVNAMIEYHWGKRDLRLAEEMAKAYKIKIMKELHVLESPFEARIGNVAANLTVAIVEELEKLKEIK